MADAFDYQPLLSPLPDEAGDGVDLKSLGVHDQIKNLRLTDDPEGAVVGNLRKGEARVADWKKVVDLCSKELTNRSKDLQLLAWLGEALAKTRGVDGVQPTLALTASLLENFWPQIFPRVVEEGDLDMRAGRLEELDRLMTKCFGDFRLTKPINGEAFAVWEWQRCSKMEEEANRIKEADQKQDALNEVRIRREALDNAIDKTDKKFYLDLHAKLTEARETLEQLRSVTDTSFRNDPGYQTMEELPPTYSALGSAIDRYSVIVEEIVDRKGGFPVEDTGQTEEALPVEAGGTPGQQISRVPGSIHPVNRADALERLGAVAQFFQRTEPHSPVAYLVLRAARWGEMSLPNWLEEVLGDPTALSRVRETLGLGPNSEESS